MYSNTVGDANLNDVVIQKLKNTWNSRVAVRGQRLDLSEYYDLSIPDFPIRLVPFWNDEDFDEVDAETRLRLLAGAWIMYNEKTIYIEDEIINPACQLLLRGELPGVSDPVVKEVIAQTLVDEQFHILMCLEVCNCARKHHELGDLKFSKPLLIRRLEQALEETKSHDEIMLAKMAYALVAEMTINTYLKALSSDDTIQPLNRLNTDMHRQDEAAHSGVFRELGISVFRGLDGENAKVFKDYMRRALNDFTEPDHSGWQDIVEYLEVPRGNILIERLVEQTKGTRLPRDFAAFKGLLDELDLADEIPISTQ